MPGSPESGAWVAGPVERVAPRLLGAVLTHAGVGIRLTEVEAYGGADDPGSHAHRGRTRRNASMFGPPGRLYVYLSYGVHVCANVVTGGPNAPAAVLLRAGEVVTGVPLARVRRGTSTDRDLARGPGRLAQALGLTLADDGAVLDLEVGRPGEPLCSGPRVGLRQAADRPWRFWLEGDPTVSRYRPARASRPVAAGSELVSPDHAGSVPSRRRTRLDPTAERLDPGVRATSSEGLLGADPRQVDGPEQAG